MKKPGLLSQNVGIDVSKDTLDVVFSTMDVEQRIKVKASRKFANSPTGFKLLEKWMDSKKDKAPDLRILMEATGIYYEQLAWFLNEKKYAVSIVLPTKAKRYFQAMGIKSKNDKIDAKALAQMGLEQRLPLWQPLSPNIYQLRLLTRQLEDFNKQRTVFLNQSHALDYSAHPVKEAERSLKKMIKALDKGIEEIEAAIERLIEQDETLHSKAQKILSIKGVGLKTIAVLIAETNGFATFENQGQLVSYSGYDIVQNQSGKRNGKTRISKKGNAHIRRAMHMPAFGVVRYVAPFASLYERLIGSGKTKMQAYVAVQRKLLILIWALWRKDEFFHPTFGQNSKTNTSGNDEPKPLFSLVSEADIKSIAPAKARATQDELPCNESPEALFSLQQSY